MQEECEIPIDKTPRCEMMAAETSKSLWSVARSLLPANQYNALRLFYIEGMKIDEVAGAMTSKVSSVKVWLHRARKRLAAHLKPT